MPDVIWIDGEWHDRASARISVMDHGLLYGDGVFEGLRAYNGRIFRLVEHLARLEASARAILLPVPQSRDELAELHREVLRRSGLEQAYLRTVLTRGAGDLGLDLRKCPTPSLIIIATTLKMFPPEKFEAGIRVVTAGTPAPHREALSPRVKSLNYLPHVMAKHEGSLAGADEVLMLDAAGQVLEGSGQNLFVVTDGVVRTPPAWVGILKGVTRDAIIELAQAAGLTVREEPLTRYDVYTADEAFLTGTASEVVPIRSLDGRDLAARGPGPVTRQLLAAFHELVAREG
ncbi:MAG TPA: branched-chain-amino-acid transaminase [Gemmatimonadales bacterium]|nr:branched-chain-amino-acid transaminase [Gemmatimonadota bacterium]HRX18238.1 branched-chain-amino-acid transaminase [Gemmatimonadales bacterium]